MHSLWSSLTFSRLDHCHSNRNGRSEEINSWAWQLDSSGWRGESLDGFGRWEETVQTWRAAADSSKQGLQRLERPRTTEIVISRSNCRSRVPCWGRLRRVNCSGNSQCRSVWPFKCKTFPTKASRLYYRRMFYVRSVRTRRMTGFDDCCSICHTLSNQWRPPMYSRPP